MRDGLSAEVVITESAGKNPEPELYAWRDAAIAAAAGALGALEPAEVTAAALGEALARSGG